MILLPKLHFEIIMHLIFFHYLHNLLIRFSVERNYKLILCRECNQHGCFNVFSFAFSNTGVYGTDNVFYDTILLSFENELCNLNSYGAKTGIGNKKER